VGRVGASGCVSGNSMAAGGGEYVTTMGDSCGVGGSTGSDSNTSFGMMMAVFQLGHFARFPDDPSGALIVLPQTQVIRMGMASLR